MKQVFSGDPVPQMLPLESVLGPTVAYTAAHPTSSPLSEQALPLGFRLGA